MTLMQVLKAGLLYFALVFGAGFLLGPIRIIWLAPRIGARRAELIESPIMLLVAIISARWVVRWLELAPAWSSRIGMGLIGMGVLLVAEFTLVLRLRGLSVRQYLETRDPVSGAVYYAMVVLFVFIPLFVGTR
jgi:hypothetical protein